MAETRKEMEASRWEIARLEILEEEVGRLQAQVGFLEKLLDSGGSRDPAANFSARGSME